MTHRVLDSMLASAAVALLALMMALGHQADGPRMLSKLDVRQLELEPRLFEAQEAFPEAIRSTLGLKDPQEGGGPEDGVDPLADALTVLSGVRDARATEFAESYRARLVTASLAIVLGRDDLACEELSGKESPAKLARADSEAGRELRKLCRGYSTNRIVFLEGVLESYGASPWLRLRLRAKNLKNQGDKAGAATLIDEAMEVNVDYISSFAFVVLLAGILGLFGFILLLVWPFVEGRVLRAGHGGLADTCSPFEPKGTFRIVCAWFLIFALAHFMFGLLAMAMGGMDRVFAVAAVSLLHGGAAIVLIQSFARRNMDERSLGECLRFRLVDVSGGKVGLLIWVLGGLCVTTACAFVAVLVNEAILGDALKEQSSVSLFTDAGSGPRLAILIVAVCVFAPVFEELLFRGYVYRNLRDRWGPGAALVISSALFAAVHTDPMNFIPLFAIGACCGYAYERSGSLWVPVLIHGLWNFTTVTRILSLMGD